MRNRTYKKRLDENGTPVMADGDFVMDLVLSEDVDVYSDIEPFKTAFKAFIDTQTQNAIFDGFSFDGVVFSMSLTAQINWSNFPVLPSALFPLPINGKNDEPYTLIEAKKMNFYFAALGFKNSLLQAGSAKKNAVNTCATIEQLKDLAEQYSFPY